MSPRQLPHIVTLIVLSVFAARHSGAQPPVYPVKPVRLLVGFVPGGGTDITARAVGQKLSERIGQPVVVDNRPGAGGLVARDIVRNAAPDGYSLLLLTSSQVVNASLIQKDPVDVRRAFAHISLLVWYPYLLVSNPSLPVKTVSEMIAYAKSRPGALNYGTPGIGTAAHLGTELLKHMAGIDMVHVPYKGSGAVVIDLMGGQIQVAFASAISSVPHVNSGKLRALAVSSGRRSKTLPNIPTVAESGVPGYDATGWYSMAAPAQTPRSIVMKLNQEIAAVLETPEVQKSLVADGAEPEHSTPEQLDRKMREEVEKWTRLLATSGIKLQ
ncbi:MAG: tripartite tricarboxylate transporter substrate binding protein [Betaproteobacteria bacterium]|nr:tripartite tricarboxylate transporter substrate binding protein [Betaproteobacteria bacterium]